MRSKKAILNISSNLLLQVVIVLYGFIVPRIIIGNYGSNVNGLISSITQFLAYISLLESGLGPVVNATLYKPIAKKDNKAIKNILKTAEVFFRRIAYIFLIYIVILCFLYPLLVSNNFEFLYTISLIVIIGISTFAEYFFGMTYRLFLQSNQESYIISFIQIVTYILSTIIIVFLARCKASIQLIKLASGIIFILRPILQNIYVKKKYGMNLKEADKNFELKQKWDGLAQHIAAVIHGNTDITILTIFENLAEVSVYSVYYLVISGVRKIINSFTSGIDATFGDMLAKNEHENLKKKFGMYEVLYNTISTIAFTCTLILIVPFVSIYTKGITDANYIRYSFGILLVISEYIWAIRLPYSSITLAAGHFKETRVGAWIECISNIVISVILVKKYGIVGVSIGTIVAMTIRTIEFVNHTNKYILDRSNWESIKKIILVIIETIIICGICRYLPFMKTTNYLSWIVNATMVLVVAFTVTMTLNLLSFKNELKEVLIIVRNILKKRRKSIKCKKN